MTVDEIKAGAAKAAAEAIHKFLDTNGLLDAPPAPTPPAGPGPFDGIDWHKLFQTVGMAIFTMVVVPALGYYGYNLPGNVEAAKSSAAQAASVAEDAKANAAAAKAQAVRNDKQLAAVQGATADVANKVMETRQAAASP